MVTNHIGRQMTYGNGQPSGFSIFAFSAASFAPGM